MKRPLQTELSPLRGGLALCLGAVTGAGLTGLAVALAGLGDDPVNAIGFAVFVTLYAVVVWSAGLLILGVPIWLLLHNAGFRSRSHALALGGLLPGVVSSTLPFLFGAGVVSIAIGLAQAAVGMVVALVVHRVAYAPTTIPPALPQ